MARSETTPRLLLSLFLIALGVAPLITRLRSSLPLPASTYLIGYSAGGILVALGVAAIILGRRVSP